MLNSHGFNDETVREFLINDEFNKSQLCLSTEEGVLITVYRHDDGHGRRLIAVGHFQCKDDQINAGHFDVMWIMNFLRQYESDDFKMALRIKSRSPLPTVEATIKHAKSAEK